MQAMYFHRAAAPGGIVVGLERDDAAAISPAGADAAFEIEEGLLGKLRASFAGGDPDFHVDAAGLAITHCRPKKDGKRQAIVPGKPQAVLQTTNGNFISDIHLVVLQRPEVHGYVSGS